MLQKFSKNCFTEATRSSIHNFSQHSCLNLTLLDYNSRPKQETTNLKVETHSKMDPHSHLIMYFFHASAPVCCVVIVK